MNLLITGFEPFAGSTTNPSHCAALALAVRPPEGVRLHTAILPVDSQGGPDALLKALDEHRPDAVICLGEAGRRARISIERVAVNLMDYAIPDNQGRLAVDEPIVPGGPAAYFATLPVKRMLESVRAAGVPAELSLSAGAYLCNQVMYILLHHLAENQLPVPAGFIHLPYLPEQAVQPPLSEMGPLPSMGLETAVRGLSAGIAALYAESHTG
ncbi:MAG: pyroglutamyl-peptidase I [Chloroflexota bacterium]|nr:MAG: pyroglutamyl-peptidase I [Chloroflexota bacterium]